jgi:hypothetical protein
MKMHAVSGVSLEPERGNSAGVIMTPTPLKTMVATLPAASPMKVFLTALIEDALVKGASDIYLSFRARDASQVRYRCQGSLFTHEDASRQGLSCMNRAVDQGKEKEVLKETGLLNQGSDLIVQGRKVRLYSMGLDAYPQGYDLVIRLCPHALSDSDC